ncbi:hypothetical protein pb186bvf_008972 [Paramecium bursaria]
MDFIWIFKFLYKQRQIIYQNFFIYFLQIFFFKLELFCFLKSRVNPSLCDCDNGYYEDSQICTNAQDNVKLLQIKLIHNLCIKQNKFSFLIMPFRQFQKFINWKCQLFNSVLELLFTDDLLEMITDFGQPISNLSDYLSINTNQRDS